MSETDIDSTTVEDYDWLDQESGRIEFPDGTVVYDPDFHDTFLSGHPELRELDGAEPSEGRPYGASWFLCESGVVLRDQLKNSYKGVVIGTVGDLSHQQGTSDHNPNGRHAVCALDVMVGKPFSSADGDALVRALLAAKDSRIKYIIYKRKIYSGTGQGHTAWVGRAYTGSDPHTNHVHISLKDGSSFRTRTAFKLSLTKAVYRRPGFPGLLSAKASAAVTRAWQTQMNYDDRSGGNIAVDGDPGPATIGHLRTLQTALHKVNAKVTVDGLGGSVTWNASKP